MRLPFAYRLSMTVPFRPVLLLASLRARKKMRWQADIAGRFACSCLRFGNFEIGTRRNITLPIWFTIRRRNDPMHNNADLTRKKASRGWKFSARLHFLDDLILVLALMNDDNGGSKTGQARRDTQLGVFQLR